MESLFFELGLVIVSAAVVGTISYLLKQPLILGFIAAGILIGPFGLGFIESMEIIHVIASVGIMLMLFLVGLEMNPARLKDLGLTAFVVGIGQVAITGIVTYLLSNAFGFGFIESIYLAIALTFSSTVIAVKMIYDKHDNASLYGQVAISILLVQDILAILALVSLAGFKQGSITFEPALFGSIVLKGLIVASVAILIARKTFNYLYNRIATSHELLILFSLAWAFVVALAAEHYGIGIEIGAFIAGVSLASLPYTYEINAKTKVLRDFFITVFFVGLGAGMAFSSIGPFVGKFIGLSLFILIGNPIIVLFLLGMLGYDKRTSFFTGLAIANISEFSLILIAQGGALGYLSPEVVSMVTIIGIVTMTVSSYFMTYNNQLYNWLRGPLTFFEFRKAKGRLSSKKKGLKNHVVLLGCGQMGRQILDQISQFKKNDYVVVDHDNIVIKELIDKKFSCIFGDIEDSELFQELELESAEIVISTLPNIDDNLYLIKQMNTIAHKKRPIVIVTADSGREGLMLFNKGADYVILRPYLGAQHIHAINRELYALKEDDASSLAAAISHQGDLRNDHDYARVLHNLNKLRLVEIKQRIDKKHIKLKAKVKR